MQEKSRIFYPKFFDMLNYEQIIKPEDQVKKLRRVLVFTPAYRPMIGGSEIALEEIIRRLPDVFFDIITPRYKREFKAFEPGSNFNIYRVGSVFEVAKLMFPILGFFKAVKLMRDKNYDVAHAYQASYGGGAGWLSKLFYPKLKFILTLQEGEDLAKQNLLIKFFRGLMIKKADIITAISNYLADYAIGINPKAKVFLIPNGIDLQKFQVSDHKLQTDFKFSGQKDNTIITVSRLVTKNGLGDLIEAFHILNTKYLILDTRLLIIGDGPLLTSLKLKVKSLNLEDKVDFVGQISNEKIPQYLAQADIFVRPSLSEGLGTAFLEAIAAGLPIIATPVGGIPDFLKDGETGLFCRVGDPEDIAEKIRMVLSDDSIKSKLMLNGRKLVEERYTWDKIALEFWKIYSKI